MQLFQALTETYFPKVKLHNGFQERLLKKAHPLFYHNGVKIGWMRKKNREKMAKMKKAPRNIEAPFQICDQLLGNIIPS